MAEREDTITQVSNNITYIAFVKMQGISRIIIRAWSFLTCSLRYA